MDERINEGGWLGRWVGVMDKWVHGQVDIGGYMDSWWEDGWIEGRREGRKEGRMEGWVKELVHILHLPTKLFQPLYLD